MTRTLPRYCVQCPDNRHPPQTNPFIPSLCSREKREPLGTNPAYRDCHSAAKESAPNVSNPRNPRSLLNNISLTFHDPSLSKSQRLNHPRRQHHQNPNRNDSADDRVLFHETLNAVYLADDSFVGLPEGDSHRPGGFDGFLEGFEDDSGEVLF